ncbi:hypothetical protein MIR68_005440 [Amoeboaphelidium protococcarum]|nr:hypothetical protein MIR68_005440 [Amoeboaphelidium protococcarum]
MECPTFISDALEEIDLACKEHLEGNGYAFRTLQKYNSLQNATLQLALISYASKSDNDVILYSTLTALDINKMVLERVLNRLILSRSVLLYWVCQSRCNLSTDAQLSIIAHCNPIFFTDLNQLVHCGSGYEVLTHAFKMVQFNLEEFRSILHHLQQKGYDNDGAVMNLILASEYSKTLVRYLQQLVTMDDQFALSVMVLVCASDDQVLKSSRASNRSALLRVLSNWNKSSDSSSDNNSIKVSTLQKILSTWSQIDCHHLDVILEMIASLVKQTDIGDLLRLSIQFCMQNDLPGRRLTNILIQSDYQDYAAHGLQLEWLLLKQFTCNDFLHPAWVNLELVVRYLCKLFIQLLSKDSDQKSMVLIQDCIKTVTIRMENESGAPVEVLSDLVLQCSQLSISSFEQCLQLLTQLQLSQTDYYEVFNPIWTQIYEQSDKVSALFRFASDEVKMQLLQFNDSSLSQAYIANGQSMVVILQLNLQQNNHQQISILFKSVLDLNEIGVITEALKHLYIYAVTKDEQLQNDYWIGIVSGCCDYIINDRVSKLVDAQSSQKDELLRQIIEFLLVMTNLVLPKQVSENIFITFRQCLGNQNVSPLCIHGLSVMIYTMSISLKKNLQSILFKLSQIMSSAWTSVHMLELLNILCSYPDLYGHFTENDYKLVLGIAVKFIEYYQSQAQKRKSVDLQQSAQALDKSLRDDVFAEYVLVLAYTVIRSWIPRVPDHLRDSVYRFTIQALSNISQSSELVLNKEKIDVCLQMLQQRQQIYGELHQQSVHDQKDTVERKLYSDGLQLISLSLLKNSSLKVEIRTSYNYQLRVIKYFELMENQIADNNLVSVENIAQLNQEKLCGIMQFSISTEILQLNDTVDRMISVMDRMFYKDAHKIAVLYVGPGQSSQQEILANSYGSVQYNDFLNNLGAWSFLKDAKSNNVFTGGLDTSEDQLDGKFVITHVDNVQQCVFHVATLMPTNTDSDPQLVSKKRHIGNDFVRIVWDYSGTDKFDLDTVSGQFNFVNIIIRPTNKSGCFKVQLQKRSDMPAFSPLCEEKIFTKLPDLVSFVRHIAIQANIFAQVCLQLLGVGLSRNSSNNKRLEYIDSRVERLRLIRRIINSSGNQ